MRRVFAPPVAAMALIAILGLVARAPAAMITFGTADGTTVDGGRPVDAQATFVTSTDTVTITLRNLQANIKDISQAISGVSFAFNNLKTGTTILTSVGQERTVNTNKSFNDGINVSTAWHVLLDGQSLQLMLPDDHPSHSIIGPALGLTYSGANSTIAGNADNNPFLVGPVNFVISVPGITATTRVDWAIFHFGICAQYVELCKTTPVPEPTTITLAATALVSAVVVGGRRRRTSKNRSNLASRTEAAGRR